ncbi:MAG: hypothetical protein ACLQGV_09775 [Bryobacteraceae bacterium]
MTLEAIHEVMPGLLAIVVISVLLTFVLLLIRSKNSVRKALIEKFTSAHDLSEFLATPTGQRLMGELPGQLTSPLRPVLKSIRTGVIFALLGLGFLLVRAVAIHESELTGVALLLMALGAGFIVSGVVSYRLSKAWGLLEKPAPGPADPPARS